MMHYIYSNLHSTAHKSKNMEICTLYIATISYYTDNTCKNTIRTYKTIELHA